MIFNLGDRVKFIDKYGKLSNAIGTVVESTITVGNEYYSVQWDKLGAPHVQQWRLHYTTRDLHLVERPKPTVQLPEDLFTL